MESFSHQPDSHGFPEKADALTNIAQEQLRIASFTDALKDANTNPRLGADWSFEYIGSDAPEEAPARIAALDDGEDEGQSKATTAAEPIYSDADEVAPAPNKMPSAPDDTSRSQPPEEASDPQSQVPKVSCDHTLYHVTRDGKPMGSWVPQVVKQGSRKRVRIACACCDGFYGYLRDDSKESREAIRGAKP